MSIPLPYPNINDSDTNDVQTWSSSKILDYLKPALETYTCSGTNKLDGERAKDYTIDTFSTSTSGTNTSGDYYTLKAGSQITNQNLFPWLKFKADTQYTLILKIGKDNTAASTNIKVNYTDGTSINLTRTSSSSDPEDTEILLFTTNASKSLQNISGANQSGTTYLYYEHIGIFEGVVTDADFEPYEEDTIENILKKEGIL